MFLVNFIQGLSQKPSLPGGNQLASFRKTPLLFMGLGVSSLHVFPGGQILMGQVDGRTLVGVLPEDTVLWESPQIEV